MSAEEQVESNSAAHQTAPAPSDATPRKLILGAPFHVAVAAISLLLSLAYWNNHPIEWALDGQAIWDFHYWRFVSTTLVHGDPVHLGFNLYWFLYFGMRIQRILGTLSTAALFVLLALGATAAQFISNSGGSIGLSGVVYGYFGLPLAKQRDWAEQLPLSQNVIAGFIIWFIYCLVKTIAGDWYIGNTAHAAGAILGFVLGRIIRARQTDRRLLAAWAALCILPVLLTIHMPWDQRWQWHRAGIPVE